MYLVLSQQRFVPGTSCCQSARIVYYGDFLYLSEDLTHFIYKSTKYNIKLLHMDKGSDVQQSNARSARRGRINVYYKKYVYDINVPEKKYFVIVQTKDVNPYLHNTYEIDHVTYNGMRFEMILLGSGNF